MFFGYLEKTQITKKHKYASPVALNIKCFHVLSLHHGVASGFAKKSIDNYKKKNMSKKCLVQHWLLLLLDNSMA